MPTAQTKRSRIFILTAAGRPEGDELSVICLRALGAPGTDRGETVKQLKHYLVESQFVHGAACDVRLVHRDRVLSHDGEALADLQISGRGGDSGRGDHEARKLVHDLQNGGALSPSS